MGNLIINKLAGDQEINDRRVQNLTMKPNKTAVNR